MTDYNELKKLTKEAKRAIYHCDGTPNLRYKVPDSAIEAFHAAANPAAISQMLDHIAQLEASVKSLHIKLAGETLRADQGWERYEYANKSHVSAIAKSASKEA